MGRLTHATCALALLLMPGCALMPEPAPPVAEAGTEQTPGQNHGDPIVAAPDDPAAPLTEARAQRVTHRLDQTPFGKAIAHAVLRDPRNTSARAEIGRAQANVMETSRAWRPSLDVGVDARQSLISNSGSGLTPFVRVSQLVYDGGATRKRRAAATADLLRAQNSEQDALGQAALAAVSAVIELRAADDELALAQRNLAAHRDFLVQIEDRRAAGVGSQTNVLTIRSRMADAQIDAVNAEATLERAHTRFKEVFGIAARDPGKVPPAPRLKESVQADTQNIAASPRLRAAEANLAVARAQLDATQSERMPRVELGGRGETTMQGKTDAFWDFSVTYRFDSRSTAASAISRAEASIGQAEAEVEQLRRDVSRSLAFLNSDRDASVKRLNAARAAREANRRTVAAARDEFSIGRRGLLEVLDAQRDLMNAERAVLEAERESLLTGYEALALTGDITTVFGLMQKAGP